MDLHAIGQALNVSAILEGSVRKSGNRLRITAQLINVADGYHLWSERYDRELQDILRFNTRSQITETRAAYGADDRADGVGGLRRLDRGDQMIFSISNCLAMSLDTASMVLRGERGSTVSLVPVQMSTPS